MPFHRSSVHSNWPLQNSFLHWYPSYPLRGYYIGRLILKNPIRVYFWLLDYKVVGWVQNICVFVQLYKYTLIFHLSKCHSIFIKDVASSSSRGKFNSEWNAAPASYKNRPIGGTVMDRFMKLSGLLPTRADGKECWFILHVLCVSRPATLDCKSLF